MSRFPLRFPQAITLTGTTSSGLALSYASTTSAVCTVSGVTVTIATVGTCTINANQAGNANYNAAAPVTQSFTVAKAAQAISGFAPITPIGYAANTSFTLSASGGASGNALAFASATPAVCTVAGNIASIVDVGTCTLTVNQAGNSNYNAAPPVSATVIVNANGVSQTISFGALANRTLAEPLVSLSASASSGLPVAFSSTTPLVCSVSGATATLLSVGTCTIAADQSGSTVYSAAPQVMQSLAAAIGAQTISFAALVDRNLGAPPFQVIAAASSHLPVAITSTTIDVCTVSAATVTIVAVGTCTITADQAGTANFAAAVQVSRAFNVALANMQVFYVHPDHLGTPRAITTSDASNTKVWEWKNDDPFGNNAVNEDPSNTGTAFKYNNRFPGQYFDQETGTNYNRFRDYDPSTGRYVQSDPIGLAGGINTFGYARGNSLRFIDPLGLDIYRKRRTNEYTDVREPGGLYDSPNWLGDSISGWGQPQKTKKQNNEPPCPDDEVNKKPAYVPKTIWLRDLEPTDWNTFYPFRPKGGVLKCLGWDVAKAYAIHKVIHSVAEYFGKHANPFGALVTTAELSYGIPHCIMESQESEPNPDFVSQN